MEWWSWTCSWTFCFSLILCWRSTPPTTTMKGSWSVIWWCDTVYDDVTLFMMMWHCVWWCDTMLTFNTAYYDYEGIMIGDMMMWHCVWWCDTVYDDVTLCMMMWHYADVQHSLLRLWRDHDRWYDDVTLCMMMWHCVWWCDTMLTFYTAYYDYEGIMI